MQKIVFRELLSIGGGNNKFQPRVIIITINRRLMFAPDYYYRLTILFHGRPFGKTLSVARMVPVPTDSIRLSFFMTDFGLVYPFEFL